MIQRDDDDEDTMRKRLKTYHNEKMPLEDYYRQKGLLVGIQSSIGVENNWAQLKDVLNARK